MLGLLSTEEPREDREDGPLPLIDSVSLVHEKEREDRVACDFFPGEPGGLISPMGIRWSTSLYECLNMRIVSSSNIVAVGVQCGGGEVIAMAARRRERAHTHRSILHSLCALQR